MFAVQLTLLRMIQSIRLEWMGHAARIEENKKSFNLVEELLKEISCDTTAKLTL
jgi:hypothetical protein